MQRLTTLCNRFGGMSSTVVGEMTHFKLPWLQRPTFTTSGQRRATSSPSRAAATSVADDRHQSTNHTDNHKLPEVYRTLGLDYEERFSPLLRGPTFCAPTLRLSFLASPIISSTSMPRILAFAALHLWPRARATAMLARDLGSPMLVWRAPVRMACQAETERVVAPAAAAQERRTGRHGLRHVRGWRERGLSALRRRHCNIFSGW